MRTSSEIYEQFNRLQAHLYNLADTDPNAAIAEARQINISGPFFSLRAGILVDAGATAKDTAAISEGIELFRSLARKEPKEARHQYNLGNGITALADTVLPRDIDWFLPTASQRRDARLHFASAAVESSDSDLTARAYANLGNSFWAGHRWAEAYDAYSASLRHDPTNGIALTGAARVLFRCLQRGIGDPRVLRKVVRRHLDVAKANKMRIEELAGRKALEILSPLLESKVRGGEMPDLRSASPYERFVARNRLALSPTIEGLDISLKRWDSLRIESVIEPVDTPPGVPTIFAMFNVMKADYLAARHIAFEALSASIPESGLYSDTLDYARYGLVPSLLTVAQRSCFDILDKVACITTEYFGLHDPPRSVTFTSRWFERSKATTTRAWHASLVNRVQAGNHAIVALGELSLDMSAEGVYRPAKSYRDASTHRFTILHDIGASPSRASAFIEHSNLENFNETLIESLRMTRSALLYLVEMIAIEEHEKAARPGLRVPLHIPDHHDIRGDDH